MRIHQHNQRAFRRHTLPGNHPIPGSSFVKRSFICRTWAFYRVDMAPDNQVVTVRHIVIDSSLDEGFLQLTVDWCSHFHVANARIILCHKRRSFSGEHAATDESVLVGGGLCEIPQDTLSYRPKDIRLTNI